MSSHVSSKLGLSLRPGWLSDAGTLGVDHFEIIADGWLWASDEELRPLERLRRDVPFYLHALGLNLGSVDGLDPEYVDRVAHLADRLDVEAVSDHLAWRSVDGAWAAGFMPLPLTPETIAHVASRVHAVQERLQRVLVLETPTEYVDVNPPDRDLGDALEALHQMCGAEVLLDVCNLRAGAFNIGGSASELVDRLKPITRYVHVAGFSRGLTLWIDDHGSPPEGPTWALAAQANAPIVLEWDRDPPSAAGLREVLVWGRRCLDDYRATQPHLTAPTPTDAVHPRTQFGALDNFSDLHAWCRDIMGELRSPTRPAFQPLHADHVFGALGLLEEAFPVTREALGLNFRWFVRELVQKTDATDVHGLSWRPAFAAFLRERSELEDHPERGALEREWDRRG